jgi:hypothetical protein
VDIFSSGLLNLQSFRAKTSLTVNVFNLQSLQTTKAIAKIQINFLLVFLIVQAIWVQSTKAK